MPPVAEYVALSYSTMLKSALRKRAADKEGFSVVEINEDVNGAGAEHKQAGIALRKMGFRSIRGRVRCKSIC